LGIAFFLDIAAHLLAPDGSQPLDEWEQTGRGRSRRSMRGRHDVPRKFQGRLAGLHSFASKHLVERQKRLHPVNLRVVDKFVEIPTLRRRHPAVG
jgi:hypothetical protein